MTAIDPWKTLPPEYKDRVQRILNTPKTRQRKPRHKLPTKAQSIMSRGASSSTELSARTKGVIKRTFDFWCSQLDAGNNGMSVLCFLAFCRTAKVVSDELTQHELRELFDGFAEDQLLSLEGFLTLLQLIADRISAGELLNLLSEYILPYTAGVRVPHTVHLLFSDEVQQVFELHRGALQLLYTNYSTGQMHPPALRSAGLYSAPVGSGRCGEGSPDGSMSLDDVKRLGSELALWPELGQTDVQTAFGASVVVKHLSYDGMCECIFRCTLEMLGDKTPTDWICNCLHQMLSSAYTQLAPLAHSPLPVTLHRTPSPSPSPAPPTPPLGRSLMGRSLISVAEPFAGTSRVPACVDTSQRRMESAQEVLRRIAPHLKEVNELATTEQYSELLQARDTLVASMLPGGRRMGALLSHSVVTLGDTLKQDALNEHEDKLKQIIESKRQRLNASNVSGGGTAGVSGLEGLVSDSTMQGIRARLLQGHSTALDRAQLEPNTQEQPERNAAVESIKARLLKARGSGMSLGQQKDIRAQLEERVGEETRVEITAGLVRKQLEGAVSAETIEEIRDELKAPEVGSKPVGLIEEIRALHRKRLSNEY